MQQDTCGFFALRSGFPLSLRREGNRIAHQILLALLVVLLGVSASTRASAPLTFSSGEQQVQLLELYTSEGCSSCPPAEAWLAGMLEHPQLWQRIVPVAFHVDYWNYLGWKDPLSSGEHSRRQRQYRREGAVNAVYTPGFVQNGQEWRGWFNAQELPQEHSIAGLLSVTINDGELTASYDNGAASQALRLQVALLGFDLTTRVSGGENRGKNLTHQFSVLAHEAKSSRQNEWTMPVPTTSLKPGRLGLAVWVTHPESQRPLQATGGWLP